jgi:ATP-dependent Lon protease
MSTIQHVPDTLAILPLDSKILLPSVVMKFVISTAGAAYLSRILKGIQKEGAGPYVGVVPGCKAANDKTMKANMYVDFDIDGSSETVIKTDGFTIKSKNENGPSSEVNLYHFGCAARILSLEKSVNSKNLILSLQGICRFRIDKILDSESILRAQVTHYPEPPAMNYPKGDQELTDTLLEFQSLSKEFINKMKDLKIPGTLISQISKDMAKSPPSQLANMLASAIETTFDEKMEMLETTDLKIRLKRVNEWMTRQLHVLKITQQIQSNVDGKLDKKRREFYLRQQVSTLASGATGHSGD